MPPLGESASARTLQVTPERPPVRRADLRNAPRIVHSLPGRVRLRCHGDGSTDADVLAACLRTHPSVHLVTMVPSIGSITVNFDPTWSFHDLIATLPAASSRGTPVERFEMDWARVALSCLLALAPFGPLGSVALALVTSIVEQLREARRSAGPAEPFLRTPGAGLEAAAPSPA